MAMKNYLKLFAGVELRGAKTEGGTKLRLSDDVRTPVECVEFMWKQVGRILVYFSL